MGLPAYQISYKNCWKPVFARFFYNIFYVLKVLDIKQIGISKARF